MRSKKNPIGIILVHRTAMLGTAFDIFVRRGHTKKYKWVRESCYNVNCKVAKKWLEKNKGYVFLGSEDLLHIPEINIGLMDMIEDLKKDGFKMVGWDEK